ncbi:MAG: ZIP family metal transporter [Actinomycetota bacterium]|nr:ZIP family metal transporter [Actinomycetota bacterium]MDQ3912239.1 ZIP family metal transporter [Actinomycetota bacterium]
MEPTVLLVSVLALLTAVATGFGAAPFIFVEHLSKKWIGVSNAVAAGLMLSASFGLIYKGLAYGLWSTLLGILIGLVLIHLTRTLINREDHPVGFSSMSALDARKALLIVVVMTAHSFAEGIAVGVSFGGGQALGLFITLAIAAQNVPEGLATSVVLVPRGERVSLAALWSIFTSLPQPIMAPLAFLFVETFRSVLPVGLGFAAGAMIWMIFAGLIPDALDEAPSGLVGAVVTLSVAAMVLIQVLLG